MAQPGPITRETCSKAIRALAPAGSWVTSGAPECSANAGTARSASSTVAPAPTGTACRVTQLPPPSSRDQARAERSWRREAQEVDPVSQEHERGGHDHDGAAGGKQGAGEHPGPE